VPAGWTVLEWKNSSESTSVRQPFSGRLPVYGVRFHAVRWLPAGLFGRKPAESRKRPGLPGSTRE